jgi:hypothetical protein
METTNQEHYKHSPHESIKLRCVPIWPTGKWRIVNTERGFFQEAGVGKGKVLEPKVVLVPRCAQWKAWTWA